jgi:hypothetical protein
MDNCNYRLHFALKIMCKDGRFKFEVSDCEFKASPLDRNSIDYCFVWLTTDNYFSKKKRTEGEADPTAYSMCNELNNFHRFIEQSLIRGAASFEKDDDW